MTPVILYSPGPAPSAADIIDILGNQISNHLSIQNSIRHLTPHSHIFSTKAIPIAHAGSVGTLRLGRIEMTAMSTATIELGLIENNDSKKGPAGPDDDAGAGVKHEIREFRIDPEIERRVVRKMDKVVVPLVMSLYLMAFLDRSNIGNAEVAGMSKELGFDDAHYQWLLTIFYIPYILFEWFSLMWKAVPPHIWAFGCVMVWGLASTLQAAAFNWSGLMACRWFLAMAEAGYGPGVPYLLSFFYKRHELGFRCGIFVSAAPLATTFAGALAYGITSGHPSIENWRLLFIVEGIPSVLLAFFAFFFLPDSPDTAKFLNEEEKEVARARAIQQTGRDGAARVGHVNLQDVFKALADIKTWIPPLMYFSCNVSFSSLPVFLPTILQNMGFTAINAQGLSAPPYFLSFLICIATTWIADRTRQRGLMIAGLSLVGGVGYILLATVKSVAVRYLGAFLAAAGVFPAIANILPWTINNQGNDSKRGAGIALLNIIGQCGPLLGTKIFPATDRPYYVKGMSICAAFMFFNALLALGLRTYLAWENRRFERTDEAARSAALEQSAVGVENEGYGFRNIL
ncbi:major facilitator superfamily domain-containing protein [Pseudomassariella vexata]|uniref:Major facilitator superfamily domain-containing protein n=1 Tax=Pseudomassariella vexata TaxID=1141098 RepID=A0A1Y2DTZ6_9PEZI|nr:major facilitator superfamily domain-containing protein [Pseudomassariella vexata]ORY62624.1 major facilitator superfamily domain-containing protein [Pseudomassariella vexata]